ncbi:MAG: peptide ABC transporter substrate-binding protein [Rubrivivax sp.]|nr:peptide ABC transporter substrate-binding protein [Pyrinomonadaceae bacterium]
MLNEKAVRLVAFILAVAMLAASCTTQASKSEYFGKIEPPAGQVLRYISGSEPESLDPQKSSGQPEARLYLSIFDGLTEYHPKTMEPIPSLAERWTVNGDASEFVFFLRRDGKFSNGDPINAHDFVNTLRRGLNPELASRIASLSWDIKYAQAFNQGDAFVRDPKTGRFLAASEATPASEEGEESAPANVEEAKPAGDITRKGEDAAPDSEFHNFIHEPERLVVSSDEKDRATSFKENPKLKDLLDGKEFVPVKAENIGVEAVDDYTVRITLRHPAPYFLGLLAHQFFRIVPVKVIEKYGVNWTRPGNIVCSGAFMLEEHKPYNQIVVVKNPHFWDAATVRLDKIVFFPLEDQTTMLNLYKAGEVDATYNHTVPASWLKSGVRQMKDYMDAPENASEYWIINTTKAPMNDKRVRQAFNYAVDKVALANYRAVAKPSYSLIPTIFLKYPRPKGVEFDPEKAKQLLAEAGFKDGSGKFDPKKFPASDVEINYNTSESNRQIAEFVQAQWKSNLGITLALRNTEWKSFLDMRSKLDYKGFARQGWVGDYMDPYTYLSIFTTKEGGDNGTGWYDTKYNAMLIKANSEPDEAKRMELLAKAEQYFLDAMPILPLMIPATSWMKKPYVKGLFPNPGTLHAWKYVYIEHDSAKWDKQMPDMTTDKIAE